jgi:LDH2 family malate/lactate/ureidoglycolate dehydrogenase
MIFAADTLRDCVATLFTAAGVPEEQATLVADTPVRADLRGHSSHGVMRAPWYLDRLHSGAMTPVTAPETVVDAGAISVMDERDGAGQVIAHRALRPARYL